LPSIPLGQGYRLEINGKVFQFPAVTRAPPEAYMSQDYVAYVSISLQSLFALNWSFLVGHTLTSVGLDMGLHGVSTELSKNQILRVTTAAQRVLTVVVRIKMHGQVVVEETL
jgi:hypothetical protein